jgi:two-component system, chemotaxis family, chemotaxis protein CheY
MWVVPLKILIVVEDSDASRDFIATMVESIAGVEAITTRSGFEALKLLPRHHFDLIIIDIIVPDMSGLELINFVKKSPNYRATPLLVIANAGREQDRQKVLSLGAAEYILKPLEPGSLEAIIRRYLKIA